MRLLALAGLSLGTVMIGGLTFGGGSAVAHNNPNQPCTRQDTIIAVSAKAGHQATIVVITFGFFYKIDNYSIEPAANVKVDSTFTDLPNPLPPHADSNGWVVKGPQNSGINFGPLDIWILRVKSHQLMTVGAHTVTVSFEYQSDSTTGARIDGGCLHNTSNTQTIDPQINTKKFVVRP